MSIKIHDNSLLSLKKYFREKLSGLYDEEEIASLFYIGLDAFLGVSRLLYISDPKSTVSESDILRMRFLAKELVKGRPIQYIIGHCEFMDLQLKVNESVLIPRPETEEIVDDIYKKVVEAKTIVDLCTGSGCIALALKNKFEKASVMGVDLSDDAIEIAKYNAEQNKLEVEFIKDDVLSAAIEIPECDLLVSNPPYVMELEKKEMHKNVLENEPHSALFVKDDDPLVFYRAIIRVAVEKLIPNGWLFMEINEKFGKEILEMLLQAGLTKNASLSKDLNGKDRWVSVQKEEQIER